MARPRRSCSDPAALTSRNTGSSWQKPPRWPNAKLTWLTATSYTRSPLEPKASWDQAPGSSSADWPLQLQRAATAFNLRVTGRRRVWQLLYAHALASPSCGAKRNRYWTWLMRHHHTGGMHTQGGVEVLRLASCGAIAQPSL